MKKKQKNLTIKSPQMLDEESMGVPCTHIIKDDGQEVAILGFDKAAIDKELSL